ncbi:MAG: Ig-like domain-containing protein [Armatimonadota bacterium]|nr:Ig-like domain-containing protein [Armatimonadota bacterium]
MILIKRAIWFAIILLALGAAAFAGQVSGVSNTFGIDNTLGGPPDIPSYCGSPYGEGTVLLRGQLHSHSYPDDWAIYDYSGTGPNSTLSKYQAIGYDFLALTDHNQVSPESMSWQGWSPNSVEITHGNWAPWAYENDTHVLAIGTSQGTTMAMLDYSHTGNIANDTAQRVQRVRSRSGLAFIAHIDTSPYNIAPDDLKFAYWINSAGSRFNAVGVFATNFPPGGSPSAENSWDNWIAKNRLYGGFWGYAEDDYHYLGGAIGNNKRNGSWIGVPGPQNELWGSIKDKLLNGDFYPYHVENGTWQGSDTPASLRITTAGTPYPTITATVTKNGSPYPAVISFRTAQGWKPGADLGTGMRSYLCTGNERYVRVKAFVVQGYNELAIYSQPVVVYGSGERYNGMSAQSVRIAFTSSELHLRYLEMEEMPQSMPPAGYVGDAFDVTTDDGLVPPGATLQLSYAGEDTSAIGGTQYLAIYHYDTGTSEWVKVGGTVDPGAQTIESPISVLGNYCISADLPPDTTSPQVFIESPPSGGIVNMNTTVTATVNDDLGAWRVSFYLNGHLLKEDADALDFWTADIPIANYCEGDWTLKAVAEDLAGNTGTDEIPIHIHSSTLPPTVAITSPTASANLSGTITATGTCGDDVAVASVTLKLDDTVVGFADIDGGNWTCDVDTTYLVDGARTLTATVEDYPGNEVTVSVQVNIANGGAVAIGSLKSLAPGAPAKFAGAIVVAGTDLVGGGFYAEDTNRISGIRVVTDRTINEKDLVSVAGMATTVGTEKAIQAYDVLVLSSNNTLPDPLGMSGKLLLSPSLDAIGKIVTVWGKVTGVDTANPAKWFTISDGSPQDVKCAPLGVTAPTVGYYVVTGVCSIDADTGGPMILLRGPDDLMIME